MTKIRIGSYNVENLFDRPKALSEGHSKKISEVLSNHHEITQLLEQDEYGSVVQARIVELCSALGIDRQDEGPYVLIRNIRGRLLRRRRDISKPVEVVPLGRADWVGWIELKTVPVEDLAMTNTARVIKDVDADIMGVIEAESRPLLELFTTRMLEQVDGTPYQEVHLIDGNDGRGIDVGLLSRFSVVSMRTHIYDADRVFSRDCAEYHLDLDGKSKTLVVLVNHFKSKGYSSRGDPLGAKRRGRQAKQVAEIYRGLIADGHDLVVVLGDLNDTASGGSLDPLLADTTLRDVSTHASFLPGERTGTYRTGNDQIDYVLLSPELFDVCSGGGIFRKGVWHGPRVKNGWEMYEAITSDRYAASDHAAIWAEVDL